MVSLLVWGVKYTTYQIQCFTVINFAQVLYLVNYRPLFDKRHLYMEIGNECIALIASYFFLSLDSISSQGIFLINKDSGLEELQMGDSLMEYTIGDFIIHLLFIQLFLNFATILITTLRECLKKLKKKKEHPELIPLFREFLNLRDQAKEAHE